MFALENRDKIIKFKAKQRSHHYFFIFILKCIFWKPKTLIEFYMIIGIIFWCQKNPLASIEQAKFKVK